VYPDQKSDRDRLTRGQLALPKDQVVDLIVPGVSRRSLRAGPDIGRSYGDWVGEVHGAIGPGCARIPDGDGIRQHVAGLGHRRVDGLFSLESDRELADRAGDLAPGRVGSLGPHHPDPHGPVAGHRDRELAPPEARPGLPLDAIQVEIGVGVHDFPGLGRGGDHVGAAWQLQHPVAQILGAGHLFHIVPPGGGAIAVIGHAQERDAIAVVQRDDGGWRFGRDGRLGYGPLRDSYRAVLSQRRIGSAGYRDQGCENETEHKRESEVDFSHGAFPPQGEQAEHERATLLYTPLKGTKM